MSVLARLEVLCERLKSDDPLATAHPIFMVQSRDRIYGFDLVYDDGSHTVFVDEDHHEMSDRDLKEIYAEAYKLYEPEEVWGDPAVSTMAQVKEFFEDHEGDFCLTRTAYQDRWNNVQPFLTRAGAEEYIRINGHNLKEPRIYVESGYRNQEWIDLRRDLPVILHALLHGRWLPVVPR